MQFRISYRKKETRDRPAHTVYFQVILNEEPPQEEILSLVQANSGGDFVYGSVDYKIIQ